MPDGSTVWLNDPAPAIERALHEASDARWARWARASWLHMTAVALMLVAFVVWLDRQGIGWAAQTALFAVPKSLDKHVGAVVMGRIDGRYLRLSSIDDERQMALRERFEQAVARQTPGTQVRLIFRASKEGSSFNAFAAPDGTICMLDDLTQALSDDEVMAVLGHELGHIVHRHGMRRVMESVGLVAAAGVVFGDASSVAGTLASTVQFLRYSRGAEREADDHMRRFVAAEKLPPEVILGVWGKFKKHTESRGAPGLPGWLASHPGLDERIQIQQSRMQTVRE